MRIARFLLITGISVALCGRLTAAPLPDESAQLPTESAQTLVKEVIYNELQDREKDSFWQYRIERKTPSEDVVEMQVETKFGPIHRIVLSRGLPLDNVQQREENARLDQLMHSSSDQARVAQQYQQDEHRLQRLMALMPDAFLYDYEGLEEGGNVVRLKFRPNGSFNPPTFEARVFHQMGGELWINLLQKRMVHLKGQILDQIDFGFGLLGHIDKGGTFEIRREPVSPTHWKTGMLDVHVAGRVILFKSVTKDQREVRSGFKPVPMDITLPQAKGLLDEFAKLSTANGSQSAGLPAGRERTSAPQ